jgi:5-methylcytosine-specific restriction endonuclease McrA
MLQQYMPLIVAAVVVEVIIITLAMRRKRFRSYEDYLQSPQWKALRNRALERDGHRCRICNRHYTLQVHHRRYAERWGAETVDDLTTLCDDCHELVSHSRAQFRIAAFR